MICFYKYAMREICDLDKKIEKNLSKIEAVEYYFSFECFIILLGLKIQDRS